MENEVSGIAKLGIVLIALAVLIALGFGIFQISKGTANTGVNNVQSELDGVSSSSYTTYDQAVITGTMVKSAVDDFEGEQVAVLISTTAWQNALKNNSTKSSVDKIGSTTSEKVDTYVVTTTNPTGTTFGTAYDNGTGLPVVHVTGGDVTDSFINYNALLGNSSNTATGVNAYQSVSITGSTPNKYYMGTITFDSNCYRCTSGFMADNSGKGIYNNITSNLKKSGTTEYVPNGAKYQAYLIKDESGTTMGITLKQISN